MSAPPQDLDTSDSPSFQKALDWQDREDIELFRTALTRADVAMADAAFACLHQRWWARTVNVAAHILGDRTLAEERAQHAWIKVYRVLKPGGSYDNTLPFGPFLLSAVSRAAKDGRPRIAPTPGQIAHPPHPLPEHIVQRRQVHARVHDCLVQLRSALAQQLMRAGLSAIFERLDTISPVANSALRDFIVDLIDTALSCVRLAQAKQDLVILREQVVSGTPNPESEHKVATALLKRTRMPPHDKECPLYDWLEHFLEAVLPEPDDKWLRYDWWAYLVAMQALAFGEDTAACALYRIQPGTFNAGSNSRWHTRMQPIAACVKKTRQ